MPKTKSAVWVRGPARSRRFGLSINVNFGEPAKSCLWDCIYCPWRTTSAKKKPLTQTPTAEIILRQLESLLKKNKNVQAVLLGGNSEPTLHPNFLSVVKKTLSLRKRAKGKWKLVILSNGSGLEKEETRDACALADDVWVKIDCAEDSLFKKVSRPAKGHEKLNIYIAALKRLPHVSIQTTLWKYPDRHSFQNWSADNLRELLELYSDVQPQNVHLVTLKRSRSITGTHPVSAEELEAFAQRVSELNIPVEIFP